jgi:hypothetical protein
MKPSINIFTIWAPVLLSSMLLLVAWSVPSISQGTYIVNADDIQADRWMKLPAQNRASFVMGFLAGLDHVYNSQGLVVTLKRSLSAQELSRQVYKSLLDQPEIRTGPIDEIILNALNNVLYITDKSGVRVDPGLKTVTHPVP